MEIDSHHHSKFYPLRNLFLQKEKEREREREMGLTQASFVSRFTEITL
jgi:hypothetical protein